MTGDPKRWLSEGSEASALERELLSSVRDVRPPAHAKEEAWQGIAAALAVGTAAAGVAASAASATSSAAGASASVAPAAAAAGGSTVAAATAGGTAVAIAKTTFVTKAVWTLAAGGIAVGGYLAAQHALPQAEPPRAHEQPAAPPSPRLAPRVPAQQPGLEPSAAVARDEELARPSEPALLKPAPRKSEPKRKDLLTAESAQLTRARAALRAGDLANAQRILQRMSAEFPRGVLAQEREVLAIEVLAARGELGAAKQRARAFEEAYPSSPHIARLRSLLDAP